MPPCVCQDARFSKGASPLYCSENGFCAACKNVRRTATAGRAPRTRVRASSLVTPAERGCDPRGASMRTVWLHVQRAEALAKFS